jgi:hypothetical protein
MELLPAAAVTAEVRLQSLFERNSEPPVWVRPHSASHTSTFRAWSSSPPHAASQLRRPLQVPHAPYPRRQVGEPRPLHRDSVPPFCFLFSGSRAFTTSSSSTRLLELCSLTPGSCPASLLLHVLCGPWTHVQFAPPPLPLSLLLSLYMSCACQKLFTFWALTFCCQVFTLVTFLSATFHFCFFSFFSLCIVLFLQFLTHHFHHLHFFHSYFIFCISHVPLQRQWTMMHQRIRTA